MRNIYRNLKPKITKQPEQTFFLVTSTMSRDFGLGSKNEVFRTVDPDSR